jgi:hypothetical protein
MIGDQESEQMAHQAVTAEVLIAIGKVTLRANSWLWSRWVFG